MMSPGMVEAESVATHCSLSLSPPQHYPNPTFALFFNLDFIIHRPKLIEYIHFYLNL